MEKLLALLKECEEDVWVDTFATEKRIHLYFDDFAGFDDETGEEIDREYENPEGVEKTLDYIEENGTLIYDGLYKRYQLDEHVVQVGFTSFDI